MGDIEQAWAGVAAAAERVSRQTLREMFAADADRFERFSLTLDDLLVDFSKERVDAHSMSALYDLARAAGVEQRRDAMFAGEPINETEGRAALHMALRGGAGDRVEVGGEDVMPAVAAERDRFLAFAEDVRAGRHVNARGETFTDVINIGIGGSDLGPAMAVGALQPFHDGPRLHFVSNVDGAHLAGVTAGLEPARTLVIVASKTFTTAETMTNARTAHDWLAGELGQDVGANLAAVSTNHEATAAFGIEPARVFGFWDWVGGRYSMWSAVGLPIAIAIGADNFRAMLDGAAGVDRHFRTAPLEENLPVALALIGIWRRNAMGWPSIAVIPYDQRLARLPAYFQQLDMESNGKRTTLSGDRPVCDTGPIVWGEPGTNAQHSFFQLLHQGSDVVPVDFLVAARPAHEIGDHHVTLAANCLAQGEALAFGRSEDEVRAEMAAGGRSGEEIDRLAPHRTFPGNRPSTTIMFRRLDPATLGRLIALYEHKVFVQAAIWNINPFDQWGVELGKELASGMVETLKEAGELSPSHDSSTRGLVAAFNALRR